MGGRVGDARNMIPPMEKTLSSESVFSGTLLHVNRDEIRRDDGVESVREWIDHPGAAAVVPLLDDGRLPNLRKLMDDGRVVMVRQYRYGPQRTFLEIPAGKFDGPHESPEDVARRECEEETGYRPGSLTYLGGLYNAVGYSNEIIHLFTATDLVPTKQSLDEDEALTVELVPLDTLARMAREGELQDMKTTSAILMAVSRTTDT